MNRHDICISCQIADDNTRINLYNKINELINEADKYAISVWSELSRHQQSEWANYIGNLRVVQQSNMTTELPDPPKRLDTLKM